jgi:molybdopterin/thiamine biosynthesis adenylyltransferase
MTGTTTVTMRRPLFKAAHTPYREGDDGALIVAGGPVNGISADIADPDGTIWALIELMDGRRDADDIAATMTARYPHVSAGEVYAVLAELISLGHVEDDAAPLPAGVTSDDTERHSRSCLFWSWLDQTPRHSRWDYLQALKNARVTIVGAGGGGSAAAETLAAEGVGTLHLADFDRVETSNLGRGGLYREDDVGQRKTVAAAWHLSELDSRMTVSTAEVRVTGPDDIIPLARRSDVLLMAADRPAELPVWVNRACAETGTPWVHAGYHGPLIQAVTIVPGDGACWECFIRPAEAGKPVNRATYPEDLTARPLPCAPSSAITAGIAGRMAARHVIALITSIGNIPAGFGEVLDLMTISESHSRTGQHQPGCEICR